MARTHLIGFLIVSSVCAAALFGCQQRPAVPTVALEPTQPVVVIVITATSQPTLAPTNTVEATITPLPTFTPVTFETVTPTLQSTVVAQVTRPPATAAQAQPTQEQAAQPTESAPPTVAAPTAFGAPGVISPEGKAFRDGDTLDLQFTSVGPLSSDQCYRIDMTLGHPTGPGGAGHWWVPTVLCGDQSVAGAPIVANIKPGRFRDEPNYGQLLLDADNPENIPPTPEYVMKWFVTVVKVLDTNDPSYPTIVETLSAPSPSLQNIFFR